MANKFHWGHVSLPVLADHSGDVGKAFKLDANGNAILATAQGELAPFILEDEPKASGEHGSFVFGAGTKVRLGNTVANPQVELTTGADGRLEPAATGDVVVGLSMAGGAADDFITAIIGLSSQIAP